MPFQLRMLELEPAECRGQLVHVIQVSRVYEFDTGYLGNSRDALQAFGAGKIFAVLAESVAQLTKLRRDDRLFRIAPPNLQFTTPVRICAWVCSNVHAYGLS